MPSTINPIVTQRLLRRLVPARAEEVPLPHCDLDAVKRSSEREPLGQVRPEESLSDGAFRKNSAPSTMNPVTSKSKGVCKSASSGNARPCRTSVGLRLAVPSPAMSTGVGLQMCQADSELGGSRTQGNGRTPLRVGAITSLDLRELAHHLSRLQHCFPWSSVHEMMGCCSLAAPKAMTSRPALASLIRDRASGAASWAPRPARVNCPSGDECAKYTDHPNSAHGATRTWK